MTVLPFICQERDPSSSQQPDKLAWCCRFAVIGSTGSHYNVELSRHIAEVQMENGVVVMAVLYLVYAKPSGSCCQTETLPHQIYHADMHDEYLWHLVERSGWSCFASIFYILLLFSISLLPLPA